MTTPTRGQIERSLSHKIQALYRDELGHSPSKITCQLFDEKLAIVVENSITQPEQLLAEDGQTELVEKIRTDLMDAIRPKLKAAISSVLDIPVLDLLSDAALESGRTGIIAVLATSPELRPASCDRKAKTKLP